jgi:hypothetical protein
MWVAGKAFYKNGFITRTESTLASITPQRQFIEPLAGRMTGRSSLRRTRAVMLARSNLTLLSSMNAYIILKIHWSLCAGTNLFCRRMEFS